MSQNLPGCHFPMGPIDSFAVQAGWGLEVHKSLERVRSGRFDSLISGAKLDRTA